jgi:hypothetical protein
MSEPRDDFERQFAERYDSYLEAGIHTMDTRRLAASIGEEPSHPTRWVRAAMIGAATVGVVVVIALVTVQLALNLPPTGTASGSPPASETPAASNGPSSSPGPSAAPTAGPTLRITADWPTATESAAVVPAQLDLAGTGFWTLETSIVAREWTLRVGTLDGRITREVTLTPVMGPLNLSVIPEPVGPANGRLLYVSDNGQEASLHVVDAATGDDRELTSTNAFIPRLAIDPAGGSAFYLALDRRSGAFRGVFGIAIDGGQPTVLIGPETTQPVATTATLAAVAAVSEQLAVSDDGQWLVYTAGCSPDACDLYAVHPADDAVVLHTRNVWFEDTIIGISGSLLVGASDCGEPDCDGFVIDLQTGERWPLGGRGERFAPRQLIAGPHGPIALTERDTGAEGTWQVEALDLTDRTRTTVFSATYARQTIARPWSSVRQSLFGYAVVIPAWPPAGAELPAGWFLIHGNADAAPAPYADYSAAPLGGSAETSLPIMSFPRD